MEIEIPIEEKIVALIGALSGVFAGCLQTVLDGDNSLGQMKREALFNQVRDRYIAALDELGDRLAVHYEADGHKHYGLPAETAVFSEPLHYDVLPPMEHQEHDWTHPRIREQAPGGGK